MDVVYCVVRVSVGGSLASAYKRVASRASCASEDICSSLNFLLGTTYKQGGG